MQCVHPASPYPCRFELYDTLYDTVTVHPPQAAKAQKRLDAKYEKYGGKAAYDRYKAEKAGEEFEEYEEGKEYANPLTSEPPSRLR